MSSEATRSGRWFEGLQAGCERLLHPSATDEKKAEHCRLLAVLLAGPFVAAPLIAQAAASAFGLLTAVSALCVAVGLTWLCALLLSTRGRAREAGVAALVLATVALSLAVGFAGGLGTPAAMLLAALPIETYWITRSRKAGYFGLAAAAVAVCSAAIVAPEAAWTAGQGWLWLSPVLYAATLALRALNGADAGNVVRVAPDLLPEECFNAAIIRVGRNGEAVNASAQAAELLGLDPSLLLGTGLFDRIHVADRVAFMCALASTRDTGKASHCTARIRMPSAGGGAYYRPFEIEIVRTHEDAETVSVLIRDGGEYGALREELTEAREKAGQIEVAKSRFLAAVSHELRTPLNAIIGFSDMLLHPAISGPLSDKQSEQVSLIREAGNHLLSVVNAILDVSKIESGSYEIVVEPFELRPTAELCCAMLNPQAQDKGVNLSAKIPDGLSAVLGDQRAVQQILINLVSNAIKFTPEGGSVSVSAVSADDTVRIFVNDTGIGIAAEDLAHLGQPFRQVQNDYTRQYQGTGLGLSLVKGLVKLHGGTMSIESAPGLGTTVMVGLPAATRQSLKGNNGECDGIALRKTA
ncbi:HAMP domain-containing sensor histidine kinase [Aminobacter sp. J44]|uniref:sensor histidine kinase n=1 Tax=Aminobacter sp. J44 TaxID=935262 RepID=UPI0016454D05|nr:HAMP domain-containing sensor histidine kinase [Aminobacter sp. J44]